MPQLTGSVGEGATNKIHDVALIQVMLRVARSPGAKKPYFGHDYDGKFNRQTKDAIVAFQLDYGLAPPPAKPATAAKGGKPPVSTPTPATAPSYPDKLGVIEPGSATFSMLVEDVVGRDADYWRLRVLPETKMVYLEMTQAEFDERLKAVTDSELQADFKAKVIALVRKMYAEHKIALAGWGKLSYRRSFADQHAVLARGTSEAGPGESNHQFGRALDVGYVGLRYILPNGTIGKVLNENQFDKHLHAWQISALYKARNALWERPPQGAGTLFRIRMKGGDNDPNHYQDFNQFASLYPDKTVDIRRSLADFLGVVSGMAWEKRAGGHYACDLGLGASLVDVGTADQIWTGRAGLSKAEHLKLVNDARRARGEPALKASEIPEADFRAAFDSLKEAFEEADRRWTEWVPKDASGNPV